MASTKKPAAKKPAAKKPAAKKPAAKKPATARPVASAARAVPSVSPHRGKTIAWYLSTVSPELRLVAERLVGLVVESVPSAKGSIKWAQPVWELNGPFAWMKASKGHVALGFWRGADLRDAGRLLEGDGDKMRHVKIAEGGEVPTRELEALLRQAAELNAKKGDPTKRA